MVQWLPWIHLYTLVVAIGGGILAVVLEIVLTEVEPRLTVGGIGLQQTTEYGPRAFETLALGKGDGLWDALGLCVQHTGKNGEHQGVT